MEKHELWWVAGILEGEGCFRIEGRQLRVHVNMTDKDILDRLRKLTQLGKVYGPYKYREHEQPIYAWRLAKRNDIILLLEAIYPIMGWRRQARIDELLDSTKEEE